MGERSGKNGALKCSGQLETHRPSSLFICVICGVFRCAWVFVLRSWFFDLQSATVTGSGAGSVHIFHTFHTGRAAGRVHTIRTGWAGDGQRFTAHFARIAALEAR